MQCNVMYAGIHAPTFRHAGSDLFRADTGFKKATVQRSGQDVKLMFWGGSINSMPQRLNLQNLNPTPSKPFDVSPPIEETSHL